MKDSNADKAREKNVLVSYMQPRYLVTYALIKLTKSDSILSIFHTQNISRSSIEEIEYIQLVKSYQQYKQVHTSGTIRFKASSISKGTSELAFSLMVKLAEVCNTVLKPQSTTVFRECDLKGLNRTG